jgi:predicted metalloprotease
MKLEDLRRSSNVEDRRGQRLGRIGRTGAGLGFSGLVLLGALWFLGVDPSTLLSLATGGLQGDGVAATAAAPVATGTPTDQAGDFVAAVLGSTEDTWSKLLQELGAKQRYPAPTLTVFTETVQSACGMASAASGPFYCPGDQKLYLDLAFFQQLNTEFGAAGDFAQAYVIAHEVGHHIQTLLGTTEAVQKARSRSSTEIANLTQVKMELQADCYAGIWAKRTDESSHFLEAGDIDEALRAAAAVGDDTIQRRVQGRVVPDSFTHGTAQQRASWFRRGFDSGALQSCDTFAAGAVQ